jgi:hypothetical protein
MKKGRGFSLPALLHACELRRINLPRTRVNKGYMSRKR